MSQGELKNHIIAPREYCLSCYKGSGPKFALSALRDTYAALRTEISFSGVDRALAQANVAYAHSEGDLLDQEITRLHESLEKLQHRRDVLRRFEDLENCLLSPIRKLPIEILQRIFWLAYSEPNYSFMVNRGGWRFRRVVTQVSSHWRAAAHACTSLWTIIYCDHSYYFENMPKKYNSKYAEQIQERLHLSNGMPPLSVNLRNGVIREALGDSCMEELVQSAYRWKDLTISGKIMTYISTSFSEESPMKNLESLDLSIFEMESLNITGIPKLKELSINGWEDCDFSIPIMISAPSLVHLRISMVYLPSISLSGFDWSRITRFEAENISFQHDEFAIILERMPNLTYLSWNGDRGITRAITLPCLEELKSVVPDCPIFEKLNAPRLKKLDIGWGFDSELSSLIHFLRRSGCEIEELKMMSALKTDEYWLAPEFNHVRIIHWDEPELMKPTLEWLTYSMTSNDALPGLERLHIIKLEPGIDSWRDPDDRWTLPELFNMLKSRFPPHETDPSDTRCFLRYVELEFPSLLGDELEMDQREFARLNPASDVKTVVDIAIRRFAERKCIEFNNMF